MSDDLEQAVSAAAADPSEENIAAVGAAWVRAKAMELVEVEHLRRRREGLIAEAKGHVATLRQAAEQAHGEMRKAIEAHEAALLAQRIFLNRGAVARAPATPETDERRGELAGNVARTQATRQRLADEYYRALTVLQRAERELGALEADGALR